MAHDLPPWEWPCSAYVHLPFCAHRCGYCDFAIAVGQESKMDAYLTALETELRTLGEPQPVETLFLGGGTPTYPPLDWLARLLRLVQRWFPLEDSGEFTIEANPETLDAEKVDALAEFGVNRVSLGAQSFHEDLLTRLERPHRAEETSRAVEMLANRGITLSLDLIFGVPGQTLSQWDDDLSAALALGTTHLSTYGLTYEQDTPLWKRRERGDVHPLSEERERLLYEKAMDRLDSEGFEHYEISNFARAGCRSRHNQTYWANEAYFGFGMGAARYIRGHRESNTKRLDDYLSKMANGESPVVESERLDPEERARETMALQLRRLDGIERASFLRQTGFELNDVASRLDVLVEQGLLDDDGDRVHLTRQGTFVADAVIARLL